MKQTDYTHSVTIAVPANWIAGANSLATLMGQNPEGDMRTFKAPSYVDSAGVEYAVSHAAVKDVFLAPTQTGTLPPDPADPMPEGYDRAAAEAAFASIGQPGGLLMAVDVDPHEQCAAWGLQRVQSNEPI